MYICQCKLALVGNSTSLEKHTPNHPFTGFSRGQLDWIQPVLQVAPEWVFKNADLIMSPHTLFFPNHWLNIALRLKTNTLQDPRTWPWLTSLGNSFSLNHLSSSHSASFPQWEHQCWQWQQPSHLSWPERFEVHNLQYSVLQSIFLLLVESYVIFHLV